MYFYKVRYEGENAGRGILFVFFMCFCKWVCGVYERRMDNLVWFFEFGLIGDIDFVILISLDWKEIIIIFVIDFFWKMWIFTWRCKVIC